MIVAELFARLGLDTKGLQKGLDQAKKGLEVVRNVTTSVIKEIKKMADESFQTAVSLKHFSNETGLSAEELQKWQNVARGVSISAEDINSSLKSIKNNQAKLKLGQGDISGYRLLGINPMDDPFKILEDLRGKTRGLSQEMKKEMLSRMGVASSFINVLELTDKEFIKLKQDGNIIPKSAINGLAQADATFKRIGQTINYLKAMFITNLLPTITTITSAFENFVKKNKNGINKVLKETAYWIGKIVVATINIVKGFISFTKSTAGLKGALVGLVAVLWLVNAPLLAVLAGFAALFLIVDDLTAYSSGRDSLFGHLVQKFPVLEKVFEGLKKVFTDVFGVLKDVGDIIVRLAQGKDIDDILKKWGKWGDLIGWIIDKIKDLLGVLADIGVEVAKLLGLIDEKTKEEYYDKKEQAKYDKQTPEQKEATDRIRKEIEEEKANNKDNPKEENNKFNLFKWVGDKFIGPIREWLKENTVSDKNNTLHLLETFINNMKDKNINSDVYKKMMNDYYEFYMGIKGNQKTEKGLSEVEEFIRKYNVYVKPPNNYSNDDHSTKNYYLQNLDQIKELEKTDTLKKELNNQQNKNTGRT